jgi:hypothetical protein
MSAKLGNTLGRSGFAPAVAFLVAVACATAFTGAFAWCAEETPESTSASAMENLSRQLGQISVIRVNGPFGIAELTRPRLEQDGLRYARGRVVGIARRNSLPSVIPMNQITAIAAGRAGPGRGARVGMLVGMLAGIVLAREASDGDTSGLSGFAGGVEILGSAAIGAAGGAIVGSMLRRWEPIYPLP